MPQETLRPLADSRVESLMSWLINDANIFIEVDSITGEAVEGGASPLMVPLVHHALRRNGIPIPPNVSPAVQYAGRVIEEAWRTVCDMDDRETQWETTCSVACQAVANFIQVNGADHLQGLLAGRLQWPPIHDGGEPGRLARRMS